MWADTHDEPDVERLNRGLQAPLEGCDRGHRESNICGTSALPEVTHNELGHYDIPLGNNVAALHVTYDPKPVWTTALYGV